MNKGILAAILLTLSLAFGVSGAAQASAPALPPDAASFEAWQDRLPSRRAEVQAFETYLVQEGVAGVLPTHEILVSDSDWASCRAAEPFALTARAQWPHMVNTLRYLRDEIIPLVGRVQVISGYRDLKLNTCAGGARHSAHADFYALDLMPVRAIARGELIAQVCASHAKKGAAYRAGLGIYNGTKFHIDTRAFRRWGPDYRSATSPCVSYEASLAKRGKKKTRDTAKTGFAALKPAGVPQLRLAMLAD